MKIIEYPNIFTAKFGDVFICVHSRIEHRVNKLFIIGSRKKCKHPNKENIDIVQKGLIQLWSGFGDNFEFVNEKEK